MLLAGCVNGQDYCPAANNFNYHYTKPQTIRSFQGIYHSNFNETITFCNFKAKSFEVSQSGKNEMDYPLEGTDR